MTVRPGQSRRQGSGLANLEPTDLPDPPSRENRTHRVRLMGIGGTGVVTTSQLLATAAILSGRYARTLDRTGLAQKGGAVVSDVTIAHVPIGEGNGFGAGECDLYLGYDLLVASDQKHLAGLALDSTAIVSTSVVPTGPMVSDPNVIFPEVNDTLARVRERLGEGQLRDLDLRRYAEGLFGAEQMGNMFVLGVAVQLGALTLLPESIEEAIALNGVAVNANTQAFRRGRQFVADRAALDAVLHEQEVDRTPKVHPPSQIVRAEKGSELERLVAIRRAELTRYQNAAYARKYEVFVERVRAAEVAHTNAGTPLSEAVSRHLYKLMAYKDEYEVARLALDPAMSEEVTQQFGEGASVQWRLHPPTLKALGLKRKIRLGPWFRPAFVALRAARRLRGTALDPFGYDRVRKLERALIAEYEAVLSGLLAQLAETGATEVYETAIEVAALPDMIRGYDSVKLRNVEGYREELVRLLGTTQGSRSQH